MCFKRRTTIIEAFLLHSDVITAFTVLGGGPFCYWNYWNFFSYIELKTVSQKILLLYPTGELNARLAFLLQCITCVTNCFKFWLIMSYGQPKVP